MMKKIAVVLLALPLVAGLVMFSIVVLMVSPPGVRWVAMVVSSILLLWAMTKLSFKARPMGEGSMLGKNKSRGEGLL